MSLAHWVYSKVILLPNNTVNPCGSMGRNILPLLTDSSSTEQWLNDVPTNAHRDSLALNAGRLVMVWKARAANNPRASTLSSCTFLQQDTPISFCPTTPRQDIPLDSWSVRSSQTCQQLAIVCLSAGWRSGGNSRQDIASAMGLKATTAYFRYF